MLSLQSNAGAVVRALQLNTLLLPADPLGATAQDLRSAGAAFCGLLYETGEVSPRYWWAEGSECAALQSMLDRLAQSSKQIFFSMLFDDYAQPPAPAAEEEILKWAMRARDQSLWLSGGTELDDDQAQELIGRWLYDIKLACREAEPGCTIAVAHAGVC